MPELSSLTKHVSNYVTIYPYKEIEDEDWPAYQDESGNWVGYDEGWREVGFKCPYPTVAQTDSDQGPHTGPYCRGQIF